MGLGRRCPGNQRPQTCLLVESPLGLSPALRLSRSAILFWHNHAKHTTSRVLTSGSMSVNTNAGAWLSFPLTSEPVVTSGSEAAIAIGKIRSRRRRMGVSELMLNFLCWVLGVWKWHPRKAHHQPSTLQKPQTINTKPQTPNYAISLRTVSSSFLVALIPSASEILLPSYSIPT